ncbi:MAG: enoyl-CoA hydratase/isomerase family protein [Planctomycetales bacterium]|nr:enoyl-CoA hydratase/isomerase family protein [Planctomycetales bacterium]
MYMQSDLVEVKVVGCSGTIIINRPGHQNALTRSMFEQLTEALDDLYRERSVRAIILTGAGETFCTGIDLQELQDDQPPQSQQQWGEDAASFRDLLIRMLEIPKPIIAAVNGPALSCGAGLVSACDIVVAAEQATIGLPDPRFGLVAGVVAPLLCHRIGAGHATRLLLSSVTIDAAEAQRIALFHELVGQNQVWARAVELAEQCAIGAPEAIQLTKRLLYENVCEQLETQLSTGAIMRATSCTTEAAQEGLAAFFEKRPPEWK